MELDLTGFAALLTALGLGPVLMKMVEYWISKRNNSKSKESGFSDVFEAIHKTYYVLMNLLKKSNAKRILLLKTTNGGGRPQLSRKLYVSVMYEVYDDPLGSVKSDWQEQELDPQYLDLLFQMNKEGKLVVETEDLPAGMLRNVYESQGIKQSYIYKIVEREKEYIYISFNFIDRYEADAKMNELFRSGVTKLRLLFQKINGI